MNRFIRKKILIAPKTPLSNALQDKLKKYNAEFIGFIDKNKQDCYKIENISDLKYDFIIIMSPNHDNAIYEQYLNFVPQNKIYIATLENSTYRFLLEPIAKRAFSFYPEKMKRKKLVFISKDFIAPNNKFLYIYCIKNNIGATMLTNNEKQLQELKELNLHVQKLDSKQGDYEIACAKFIIFDQGDFTYLPKLSSEQKIIQLWHGVGLKKMSRNTNIEYDYFISTSNWTNDTNFKNIFLAKKYLNCGYPRNDIFFNKEDKLDLLVCDKKIYNYIKNTDQKVIIYMPTHKEGGYDIGLNIDDMNLFLSQNNILMILKLHPFVLKFYNSKDNHKKYSNIVFHNANGDIYPLLKYTYLLISDYSSIVYDYLLLDKPIIFYTYDLDIYTKNVQFLYDYDAFSPGDKVGTVDELKSAIIDNLKNDNYKIQRNNIKDKFFDFCDGFSSKRIIDKMHKG